MLALVFLDCQVKVADRTAVVTANAETVVVSPPGLQEAINEETGIFFVLFSFYLLCHICLKLVGSVKTCELPTAALISRSFYFLRLVGEKGVETEVLNHFSDMEGSCISPHQ